MKPAGNRKTSARGFTLVELAIVMVVIGLLIGGVLKGQEMITQAQVSSTMKYVTGVQGALSTYQDRYSAYPGDDLNALTRVPNCTTANYCASGDGNSQVGFGPYPALFTVVSDQPETVQFWKHLALSDMISGIDPTANPATLQVGKTHPATPLKGTFEFFYGPFFNLPESHMLRMTSGIVAAGATNDTIGAVSPNVAAQIDRKMDNGDARNGSVIIWDIGDFGCDNLLTGEGGMDETITSNYCTLLFKMK